MFFPTPTSRHGVWSLVEPSTPYQILPPYFPQALTGHHDRRSFPRSAITSRSQPAVEPADFFEYTAGRWMFVDLSQRLYTLPANSICSYNEGKKLSERRRFFNVRELKRLAAASVARDADDVVSFEKHGEGGFNRVFFITMRDGFPLIARIPYPVIEPKFLLVASEAATMDYLHLNGIPVPKIYDYSATSDNAAGTEYIFMEVARGTNLGSIWYDMSEKSRIKFIAKFVQLEARLFALRFPASGSLYHSAYLNYNSKIDIPAVDGSSSSRFCIGPETTHRLWHRERLGLEVDRGPYTEPLSALLAGANKEIAYLRQFRQPMYPLNPIRREIYDYGPETPMQHLPNLEHYLQIAPHLVPQNNDSLLRPTIRHPDLNPNNIFVSDDLDITCLIDWQHSRILPLVLHCGIPNSFQNYGDSVSEELALPELPDDFDQLNEREKGKQMELLLKRQLHFFYFAFTEKLNPTHYHALSYDCSILRRKVYELASNPWEGDWVTLKEALIQVTEKWSKIAPPHLPCPISFTAEEITQCRNLHTLQMEADEALQDLREAVGGVGVEGWIPTEHYEEAKQREQKLKAWSIEASETEYDREMMNEHWPFSDHDEQPYTWQYVSQSHL